MAEEMWLSTIASKTRQFPKSLLLSDLFYLLPSFILYLSYFIFFSPYLFKLLSFLSPLFLTTSLLLFSALSHRCRTLISDPKTTITDQTHCFEELEIYRVVFGGREDLKMTLVEQEDEEDEGAFFTGRASMECTAANLTTSGVHDHLQKKEMKTKSSGSSSFESFSTDQLDGFEEEPVEILDKKIEAHFSKSNKVGGEFPLVITTNTGSKEATCDQISRNTVGENDSVNKGFSCLGSFGSMREKEWKRTLAGKLFEEKHGGCGEEGMDSLWEAYEVDSSKKKGSVGYYKYNNHKGRDYYYYNCEEEEDADEEEFSSGQFCCLRALKLSSGKVNLGVGKPINLVKISKALKGFGWLHRGSKNGKKR